MRGVNAPHAQLDRQAARTMTHQLDTAPLNAMERHFHNLILVRVTSMGITRMPELPRLINCRGTSQDPDWFAVDGMYGGFAYWIESADGILTLTCESWSRVVEGSGQRHSITSAGADLVAEGFV
jgi:hypothetical protein